MSSIIRLTAILLLAFATCIPAKALTTDVSQVPNVQLADSTKFVSDPDNILSAAARNRLNAIALDIRRQTSAEVAIVVLDSIDGDTSDFATQLFNSWQIGKKDVDNGLLILVARGNRESTIRTGRGVEGILPDAATYEVQRRDMNPLFKIGDYDQALIDGLTAIQTIMTDTEARAELMSHGDTGNDLEDLLDFMLYYLAACIVISLILGFWVNASIKKAADKGLPQAYSDIKKLRTHLLMTAFALLGMPLIWLPRITASLKTLRDMPRRCKCGATMNKLNDYDATRYLTPAQSLEKRINSIDYDVWQCPECSTVDIIPFVNESSPFEPCPYCGARTSQFVDKTVAQPATTRAAGYGYINYRCLNCGNTPRRRYTIPKEVDTSAVVLGAAAGAALGSRGRGFGGGGGFGGGSFGGGSTGGGGSTSGF